jgi:hypothetical protein
VNRSSVGAIFLRQLLVALIIFPAIPLLNGGELIDFQNGLE